jgi:ketosteroid isomerase-like protein
MSFDPMAEAIDWLDAYRASDISIVDMYADDAALECACTGAATFAGRDAISAYWQQRFLRAPAGELVDLYMKGDAVALSYRASAETVLAILTFNDEGKIVRSTCGPVTARRQ